MLKDISPYLYITHKKLPIVVLFFYMDVYTSTLLTNSRPLTSTFPMNITTYH